jgi:hypothetical protein
VPWLGDVPVLGALFRSAAYQKNETDLAIIVTPRLVRPTRPGDPVKTPLDNTLPANDIDFFLMGKAEVSPAEVGSRRSPDGRSSATFSMCEREALMSSPSRTERSHKTLAAIIAFGALLGGCSDIYYDRRETVALGADDADRLQSGRPDGRSVARYVGDKNIAFNGQRMQAAVERYRNGKIIPPVNATTTSMTQAQASARPPAPTPPPTRPPRRARPPRRSNRQRSARLAAIGS